MGKFRPPPFIVRSRGKNNEDTSKLVSDDVTPYPQPVVLPLEDSIDLHAFQPKDIPSVVEEYLEQCKQAGFRELRIIHGKGTGAQRNIVRSILENHPAVDTFGDAPPERGSWGATLVVLRRAD